MTMILHRNVDANEWSVSQLPVGGACGSMEIRGLHGSNKLCLNRKGQRNVLPGCKPDPPIFEKANLRTHVDLENSRPSSDCPQDLSDVSDPPAQDPNGPIMRGAVQLLYG